MTGVGIIVFARLDSRRLPGKALTDLVGRPLLARIVDRLRRVAGEPRVVIATSGRPIDDPVASLADEEGVALFRGVADDVAARALACAEAFGFADFVRISGDSPFVDPDLTGEMIAAHARARPDLTTNIFPRTFPAGVSVEIVATAAMRRAVAAMTEADEREHVTLHCYRRCATYRIRNVTAGDGRHADVRLAVDTPRDLEMARRVMARLGPRPEAAGLDRVTAAARACGWLATSNAAADVIAGAGAAVGPQARAGIGGRRPS